MSLTKKDRINRSVSGTTFPPKRFADAIAAALRREYGGTHAAVKTVVALTGANERAVKNWFDAKNGPSGEFLIALCAHSDEVLRDVPADGRQDGACEGQEDRRRNEQAAGDPGDCSTRFKPAERGFGQLIFAGTSCAQPEALHAFRNGCAPGLDVRGVRLVAWARDDPRNALRRLRRSTFTLTLLEE